MDSMKDKAIRLFQFLKQYNDIKNPLILDIKNQVWVKWMDNLIEQPEIYNNVCCEDREDDILLTVVRPVLSECPKPPEAIKSHLQGDMEDVEAIVTYKNIDIEEDKSLIKQFVEWESKREKWICGEKPLRIVDNLFNEFYSLYSNLKKEAESVELMFGDGILFYNGGGITIDHPIVLQKVKLEFDPNIPKFILKLAENDSELYRSVFYNIDHINDELLKDIYIDFEKSLYSPADGEITDSFLNRLSNALSAKGKFLNSKNELEKLKKVPQIYRRPVLFLRKRNLGFNSAIDGILEEINKDMELPEFLNDIIGNFQKKPANHIGTLDMNGIDEEILLTKPANSEQLAVAKYLKKNGSVLVQGPPGTGKTHTIANMIGHLLSEGKSILVTSYSEKALSVMKEKVEKNLQALCLSLLSSNEARDEMEKTLDEINENRSRLDIGQLSRQIDILEKVRREEIEKLNNLRLQLKNTRLNEYRPIVVGGEEYKPIEAARFINDNRDTYGWIPEPISPYVLPSLLEEDIIELYNINAIVTKEDEEELSFNLIKTTELLSIAQFNDLINKKMEFKEDKLNEYKTCWNNKSNCTKEQLNELINDINEALININLDMEWTLAAIEAGSEEVLKKQWINLIYEVDKVYELSLEVSEQIIKYNPEIIHLEDKFNIKNQLEKIISKLETSGKVTRLDLMFNQDMKKAINNCRVNGKIPTTINEFKAVLAYYNLEYERIQLRLRWDRQLVPYGAEKSDKMGINFEAVCKKYCVIIKENLNWREEKWEPILKKLKVYGLNIQSLDGEFDLSSENFSKLKHIKLNFGNKLIAAVNSQIYRLSYKECEKAIASLKELVDIYCMDQNSRIMRGFQEAIIRNDITLYNNFYDALIRLKSIEDYVRRRQQLLDKLRETAPAWAKAVKQREGVHGNNKPPSDIKKAWLFAQFNEEIKRRNNSSIEKIQNEIIEVENNIKENTSELAFKKAWKERLNSISNSKKQVQAIEAWRQIMRKVGTGKGKRAELLKAEARKLMPECQSAVPVWIMPLTKVVESFNPSQNKFDVVIIDEASQADFVAIVALFLGKQVIIVGDNEQVSPLAIGEKAEDIDRLIKEYLFDIPNSFLYSGKFSVYDLAQTAGYQPVRLKEHFRCVPEIIQYSNILSYNGQIKPLRDSSKVDTKPHVICYRVENAICKNKVNEKEAQVIVSLIMACLEREEYKNSTFGVITLRGEKQALLIDKMLQGKMEPKEYRRRRILCGNSANFQGDERDVIFLSMVDTNEGIGPLRFNGYGNDNLYKKRYNVAVSRAKDQIWLVHSLDEDNDLKLGDIRKELISYFKNSKGRENEFNINVKKAESEFEKRVMKYLINKGYKVVPQWQVGAYRIDMVILSGENKIALECDGDKWHGEDKLLDDMNRQAILERLGWRFIRIRGSEFFSDEASVMGKVYEKLTDLDIFPEKTFEEVSEYGLKEKIIMKSEELLRMWNK